MQRTISGSMATYIAGDTMAGAVIIKLKRVDGTILSFCTWDVDLVYNNSDGDGSLTYKANSSFISSTIKQASGTGVDNLDVMGGISSVDISDTDLIAGRYDTAAMTIMFVNPTDLSAGHITLHRGYLGEIKLADGKYTVELRALSQKLSNQIGELISPSCRVVRLGNSKCIPTGLFGNGNALTFYRVNVTVVSYTSSPPQITFSGAFPAQVTGLTDPYWYNDGICHMNTGNNSTIEREVKTWTYSGGNVIVTLQDAFNLSLNVGDSGYLEAGCDRIIDTCASRFGNQLNARCESYVPGMDAVLYRGSG